MPQVKDAAVMPRAKAPKVAALACMVAGSNHRTDDMAPATKASDVKITRMRGL